MSSAANAHAAQRQLLIERCQHERNQLIAMAATAHALLPRPRTWTQAARTLCRLLRVLVARVRRATSRKET
jgi:hypothetical protein